MAMRDASSETPPEHVAALRAIAVDLAQMGGVVEAQLADAIAAIERRDIPLAEKVRRGDEEVDRLDREIEARVAALLEQGRVRGREMRAALTAMKIAGELERVGDLAKNVAKRTLVVSRQEPSRPLAGVVRMGRISLRQISDVLNAYAAEKVDAAVAVWGGDDELDELYNSLFREILVYMMNDPGAVNACTHLVFVAKNFERVGDHATNIAEAIHFMVTGAYLSDQRPKTDMTSLMAAPPPNTVTPQR